MSLLLAEVAPPDTYNPLLDNVGMVVIGVIVLVVWLLFRHMLKLSERGEKR